MRCAGYVKCRSNPGKTCYIYHAEYTAPIRELELDHTDHIYHIDHTDHTDHTYHTDHADDTNHTDCTDHEDHTEISKVAEEMREKVHLASRKGDHEARRAPGSPMVRRQASRYHIPGIGLLHRHPFGRSTSLSLVSRGLYRFRGVSIGSERSL